MRGIVTNEYKLLEDTLNGKIDNIANSRRILVKKCLQERKTVEETTEYVNSVISQGVPFYRPTANIRAIRKCYRKYLLHPEYTKIDKVAITESEWEKIISINDVVLERTLLVLLVYWRVYEQLYKDMYPNNSTLYVNDKDVFINVKNNYDHLCYSDWNKRINKLFKEKYLVSVGQDISRKLRLRLNYTSDNIKEEVKFEITDFDNIYSYYDEYRNGTRYVLCQCCSKRIKKTNNRIKYCSLCAKKINIQKTNSKKKKLNKY